MCWYIFVPFSVYFEQSEITETESNNGTEITDVTEVEDDLLEGENDNDIDNEDQDRKPPLRYSKTLLYCHHQGSGNFGGI